MLHEKLRRRLSWQLFLYRDEYRCKVSVTSILNTNRGQRIALRNFIPSAFSPSCDNYVRLTVIEIVKGIFTWIYTYCRFHVGFQATTLILLFSSCNMREQVSCFSGDSPLIPSISSSSSPIPLLLPLLPFPFPFRFFFLFNCRQSISVALSVVRLILALFFICLSYSKAS